MNILLPVLIFSVPVMVVVLLAVAFGRRLKGSCGGVATQGSCSVCGRTANEIAADPQTCER